MPRGEARTNLTQEMTMDEEHKKTEAARRLLPGGAPRAGGREDAAWRRRRTQRRARRRGAARGARALPRAHRRVGRRARPGAALEPACVEARRGGTRTRGRASGGRTRRSSGRARSCATLGVGRGEPGQESTTTTEAGVVVAVELAMTSTHSAVTPPRCSADRAGAWTTPNPAPANPHLFIADPATDAEIAQARRHLWPDGQ